MGVTQCFLFTKTIKYFTSAFPFYLKKKVVSVTAQEINDILGSIPSPCRLPGIRAPLLPLPGMESCPHSPSASFVTSQSHSKAGKKPQWAQRHGTARGQGTSTLPALLELPALPGLTQKKILLVSPPPQPRHHKHTGERKREKHKKMLIGKGFVQLHNSSYKTFVIIDFCP